jgi:hypothetical protein
MNFYDNENDNVVLNGTYSNLNTNKKRSRDNSEENFNVITSKRGKFSNDKEIEICFEDNNSNHLEVKSNLISNVYDSFHKNNLDIFIWKLVLPKEQILNLSN